MGWSTLGQVAVGRVEKRAAGQWKRERERERAVEKGGEGWRDGCKVRTLRKDK